MDALFKFALFYCERRTRASLKWVNVCVWPSLAAPPPSTRMRFGARLGGGAQSH